MSHGCVSLELSGFGFGELLVSVLIHIGFDLDLALFWSWIGSMHVPSLFSNVGRFSHLGHKFCYSILSRMRTKPYHGLAVQSISNDFQYHILKEILPRNQHCIQLILK